jgi:hypothetical protein
MAHIPSGMFLSGGGFPKTSVLGKQPYNSRFCPAESLKNHKSLRTLAQSQLVLGQVHGIFVLPGLFS